MKPIGPAVALLGALHVSCAIAYADKTEISAIETVSGAPATTFQNTPAASRPAPTPPTGLCDSHHPRIAEASITARPVAQESECAPTPSEPTPLWRALSEIERTRRGDARISIEPLCDLTGKQSATCDQIEALWNNGKHDDAIRTLRRMDGVALGMGISWFTPQVGKSRGLIGGSATPVMTAITACWTMTRIRGNLFAVIRWQEYWTVNLSTDGGATWARNVRLELDRRNHRCGRGDGGRLSVRGVRRGQRDGRSRLRRCAVDTGAEDGGYGFHTAFTAPADIVDVALESNADSFDNRIYYAAISSDNALHFRYDVASDGTTFTNVSPDVDNAAFGLDMHWNEGASISPKRYWFVSYIGTDNRSIFSAKMRRTGTHVMTSKTPPIDKPRRSAPTATPCSWRIITPNRGVPESGTKSLIMRAGIGTSVISPIRPLTPPATSCRTSPCAAARRRPSCTAAKPATIRIPCSSSSASGLRRAPGSRRSHSTITTR